MSKSNKKWELVTADGLDYETANRIGMFMNSFADTTRDRKRNIPEYFIWKVARNPNGRGLVSLAVAAGKIVGGMSLIRKRVWFRGQIVEAGEYGDGFTDPAYQGMGIFTTLAMDLRDRGTKKGIRLFYGLPNAAALRIWEGKLFSPRKANLNMFLWVLPVSPLSVLLRRKDKLRRSLPVRAVDGIVEKGLRCISALWSAGCEKTNLVFDDSFDLLDEKLRQQYDFMLSRQAVDLEFRLKTNPESHRYGIVVKHDRTGSLEAVLIFKDTVEQRVRVFFIADAFGLNNLALTKLWNTALMLAVQREYKLVALWAPRTVPSVLTMLPVPPIPVARKELVFTEVGLGRAALDDKGHWLFSILDSDNI